MNKINNILKSKKTFFAVMMCIGFSQKHFAEAHISGLFHFRYTDGQKGADLNSTAVHNDSMGFSIGQMNLFIEGDISKNTYYTGEVVSDLYTNDREERPFRLRTASVTMTNLWRYKSNVEFGKFDTIFGSWTERRLPIDNALFSAPLAYSYKVHLSPNAGFISPAVRNIGNSDIREIGIIGPDITNTGAKLFGRVDDTKLSYAFSATNNSLSNSKDTNINNSINIAAKLHWDADQNTSFGVSASQGAYLNSLSILDPASPQRDASFGSVLGTTRLNTSAYLQTLLGGYINYKYGRLQLNSEFISSTFQVPNLRDDLVVDSFYVEGKINFTKEFFGAARFDTLTFNDDKYRLNNTLTAVKWDDNLTRAEIGVGTFLNPSTLAKLTYQTTDFDLKKNRKDFDLLSGSFTVIF
ncbi:MAG: hypothetical protein COB02_13500 [Candidatus Cloacimonadota bacterium]|nr:MAG: hypothetical protein COB02_13500 [Candidatus Cloacimonadota bacterium]